MICSVGKLGIASFFFVAIVFVLYLNGAVPFVASPTLGQAVAMTGYSEAFAREEYKEVYSNYFGYPKKAPLAMGFPIAFPAGFLIRFGMHATDAYSTMVGIWLVIAYFGAYFQSKHLGLNDGIAILSSALWMSMPLIWGHAGYSSLSVGISLIPSYFYAAHKLFTIRSKEFFTKASWFFIYIAVCSVALFMDGYSFMMFAISSSLLLGFLAIFLKNRRSHLFWYAVPSQIIGFGLAYGLYHIYIGELKFTPAPIDVFRGWGLDLTFLLFPTQGVHWFWDTFGLSSIRSSNEHFGDSSVWKTTFALPLILAGFASWCFVKGKNSLASLFLVIVLFSFYMAMGPSLKFNSVKPYSMGSVMPAEFAVAPTGNAFISETIPGFRSMRASYRWWALGTFGLWALLVLFATRQKGQKDRLIIAGIFILLIMMNIPNLKAKWIENINNRNSFFLIDGDLVEPLRTDLKQNELVAFLPYRNDFMINYLAPKIGIRAYNIGGDKQLENARKAWPETMQWFRMGTVDYDFANRILILLARNEVDVVILPYIDMLWAAHKWPYPVQFQNQLELSEIQLNNSGFVDLENRKFYASVRLKPEFLNLALIGKLENIVTKTMCLPPICLKRSRFSNSTPSLVGSFQNGRLQSDGRAGFVHYGPYVRMNPGSYELNIFGSVEQVSKSWVDVVSGKGTVQHGKFILNQEDVNRGNGVLFKGYIELNSQVNDIEVRLYVGETDKISLDGYELIPKPMQIDSGKAIEPISK